MRHERTFRRPLIAAVLVSVASVLAGCADAEPQAPAAEETAGDEQSASAQAAADAAAEQAASEQAMEEVVKLSMKLGSQRAALSKQLDKPRPDCERSETLRDRICETAASICTISEQQQEAVGHCDRSTGKCEKAKRDVDDLRCRRRGRRKG